MSDSKFRVLATGPSPNDLATYRNEVMSVVRGVLDAIGFHLGTVLTLELHGFVAFPVNGSAGLLGAPVVACGLGSTRHLATPRKILCPWHAHRDLDAMTTCD